MTSQRTDRSPRGRAGRLLLAVALATPVAARAQLMPISTGGPATVAFKGGCQSGGSASGAWVASAPAATAQAAAPLRREAERRCARKLGRVCQRLCPLLPTMPLCEVCADVAAVCRMEGEALTCPRPDPDAGARVEAVEVVFDYAPLNLSTHQWGCRLVLRQHGAIVFSGFCGFPSLAPGNDLDRNLLLMPMFVQDVVEDETLGPFGRGSFGDFRGYLVVVKHFLDRPYEYGPEGIRGITGQLTYQVATTWLNDSFYPAPWRLDTSDGEACVLSGRLHFGDVPKY